MAVLGFSRVHAPCSGARSQCLSACPRSSALGRPSPRGQVTCWSALELSMGDAGLMGGGGGKGPGPGRMVSAGDSGDERDAPASRSLWAQYLDFLDSNPVLSRALTRGVVTGLGNIICQLLVEKGDLNLYRLAMYSTMGFCLIGPTLYYWYGLLAKLLPGSGLPSVLASVALDQLVFQPPWIALIMTTVAAFEGKLDTLWPKLQQDWVPAVQVSLAIWVPAQLINFKFMPLKLRVTYDTVVAVMWHVFLSYQSHKVVQSLPMEKH